MVVSEALRFSKDRVESDRQIAKVDADVRRIVDVAERLARMNQIYRERLDGKRPA